MSIIMECSDNTERVCIQTNKVFDACLRQQTLDDQTITVTGVNPATLTPPMTNLTARSSMPRGTIRNLTVTPQLNSSLARFTGVVDIPLTVSFKDSLNVATTGSSILTVPFDVMLTVPQESIMPYQLESMISASSRIGTYVGTTTVDGEAAYVFSINICIALVLKIVMQVELIVASSGYAVIPPCTDFSDTVCDAFFNLPLYPEPQ